MIIAQLALTVVLLTGSGLLIRSLIKGLLRHASLEEKPQFQAYLPFWQAGDPTASVVLRTNYDSSMIVAAVRKVVNGLDSSLAIGDVRTMDQLVAESTAGRRFQTVLLAAFSGVALLLSLVGLYALVAYSVRQRTAEIGIRMALGAQRRDVIQLIVGQGAALALTGIGLGLLSASVLGRLLASLLFEVKATDGVHLCNGCTHLLRGLPRCLLYPWAAGHAGGSDGGTAARIKPVTDRKALKPTFHDQPDCSSPKSHPFQSMVLTAGCCVYFQNV